MEQNQLTPFAFGDNMVRVRMDKNGNPWFVAKDVAAILDIQNIRQNLTELDDDEKGVCIAYTPGGNQEMNTISESGLYALVFRSRKPEAKAFSKWVRAEVLPALRKTGSYAMPGGVASRRAALPGEMPPEALILRPAMRQRLWRDALDSARLENGGLDLAVQWFGKLCRLMAAQPPAPDSRAQMVRDFVAACCVTVPGSSVKASVLYEAMRRWRRGKPGEMPSMRIFGEIMSTLACRLKSNGSVYRDIALK